MYYYLSVFSITPRPYNEKKMSHTHKPTSPNTSPLLRLGQASQRCSPDSVDNNTITLRFITLSLCQHCQGSHSAMTVLNVSLLTLLCSHFTVMENVWRFDIYNWVYQYFLCPSCPLYLGHEYVLLLRWWCSGGYSVTMMKRRVRVTQRETRESRGNSLKHINKSTITLNEM